MAVKVTIKNLKGIRSLEFDVPMTGAYVITGANGCGKTSLLTALHRMGVRNAFQTGLPGGRKASGIDGIEETTIQYDINGKSVIYRYNNTRWSATPKAHSTLVTQAFSEVMFFKADSSRVEPTQNEVRGVRKQPADNQLRQFMNTVFDTNRFDNLVRIQLRGRNLTVHLMDRTAPADRKKSWYSEKAFSLGELCVMRLGQKLSAMKNGGLYIIDEFEMALHPAAQIRLFREIEKIAQSANCVALVSTHSSSLIKSVKRSNIIYLENIKGMVSVFRNVYPTYALQYLSLEEESAPDKLILVEDGAAKLCVEAMWQEHLRGQQRGASVSVPSVQVVVIGGYKEVLRFLERSQSFVPAMTRRLAALDADAEPVCLPTPVPRGRRASRQTVPQQLYAAQPGSVHFLPWTPEVGLCDLLVNDFQTHSRGIKTYTGITNLTISQALVSAHVHLSGRPQRDSCKFAVDAIAATIAQRNNWSDDRAREAIFQYLVAATLIINSQAVRALSGKLFN